MRLLMMGVSQKENENVVQRTVAQAVVRDGLQGERGDHGEKDA
jgi:hypothetical protein